MQEAYKAIADPTRRRILQYLRGGERTAGELAEYSGVGRTALRGKYPNDNLNSDDCPDQ